MFKVDLHTHSVASPDGGITREQYLKLLEDKTLDYIAVTDHDTIDFALKLQADVGERIIVGQEVTTTQGELIGLFLTKKVTPRRSLLETAQAIKDQGGLVYVPHPFETVRKGVKEIDLDTIADFVDIVEVYNGRAVAQNKGPQATVWARLQQKATAASSDAHGVKGVGTAYSVIEKPASAHSLAPQLNTAHKQMSRPPMHTLLYPKLHRLRRKLGKA